VKPRGADGALIGGAATLAVAAASYLGWKLAGLAFAPFDLFDWAVRALPGSVATAAIDAFIFISRALPLGTSAAAKTAEQTLAVAVFVAAGTAVVAVLYAVLAYSSEPALLAGLLCGAILSGVAIVAELGLNRIGPGLSPDHFWLAALGLAWGAVIGWTNERLQIEGHASSERPGRERRRLLVRLASATIGLAGMGAVSAALLPRTGWRRRGERWSQLHALPNASSPVVPVAGTRPELTALEDHYRIDADTRAPVIDEARWTLKIRGLVSHPLDLTLQDLQLLEPTHQFVTLSCISNPVAGDLIGTTRWTGVSLQRVLPRAGLQDSATHLRISSADGFFEVVDLEQVRTDPRVMLAYAWDGVPLAAEHGFPLRLYVPDVYGMKQPKWIRSIDAINHWEPGYWVARGWDRTGQMKATSVIDTVVVDGDSGGRAKRVLVGGIAHAGARGISKVEIQVDDGEWHPAELREPLSRLTWVIWRSSIMLDRGTSRLAARCFDGEGAPQAEELHVKQVAL
jgi:DMSO/TMAO reductase YedYZ molybdopterin-dependent catalytic subunit